MSDAGVTTGRTAAQTRPVRAAVGTSRQRWLWVALVVCAMALPWLFYGWQTHRHSGFLLTMLSQMGMMIIFSLSYNMLMGQAGLLSFGHAVFFGLAGYSTIHLLDAAGRRRAAGADGVDTDPVGAGRVRLWHRLRLHGDPAARHRLCDDHAGDRRTC